ncbi:conserved protein of unknown function (plasmid) [Rhodovastum atsumiense]|uniref:Terminase n=1 Tax=Rhodovastum atsumiense TaxID=504468 RepID=A0A5M6IQB0_9PROT|nr:hypothetical protein [Rhodovastum atsumiense]KAA5609665.1 hypothetical protein F1189_23175 [Rhodovastum atsumiense]CAH2606428.1 conserved protein of unknown function [Rhodovastum atsumiense]
MPSPDGGARAPGRKQIDWEAVEREYRTGTFSTRQLAAKHGCAEGAIRWHAKKGGWQKDLTEAVRRETDARLLRADLRTTNAREDAQIVSDAAETRVAVVLRHRRSVARDNERLEKLATKLDALIEGAEGIAGVGAAQDILESMARTRAKLIPLERQAFGLTDKEAGEDQSEIRTIRRVIVEPGNPDTTGVRPAPGAEAV